MFCKLVFKFCMQPGFEYYFILIDDILKLFTYNSSQLLINIIIKLP